MEVCAQAALPGAPLPSPCERGDHLSRRPTARPAAHGRQPRPGHRRARVGRRVGPADPARPRRHGLRRHLRRVRADARRRGVPRRVVGPPRPRRLAARRALQLGGRPPRLGHGVRLRHPRPGDRHRPLQGREPHAPARRRAAPPGEPPDQPRRAALAPQLPGRVGPPAHQAHGQGAHRAGSTTAASLVTRQRRPGTIDELAERRRRMNPRLDPDWLRYLVTVGAREDADGWRWKIDPTVRFGGFGPWRPEWSMMRLPDIGVPVLAILGAAPDPMGWGTPRSDVLSHMPPGGRLEVLDDVGHFVHIEQPRVVADLVLEHLG